MHAITRGFVLTALCIGGFASAQTKPYAGQEQRVIKSMSEQEVAGLLAGAKAERDLDKLFAQRVADAHAIDAATRRVGLLQASLRAEHLKTHVAQASLLSDDQVRMYEVARGYTGAAAPNTNHSPPGGEHRRSH